jgi:hypothetical protein
MGRVVLIVFILLLLGGCDDVSYVEKIIVINPTDYDVLVDVKGEEDNSWLTLGTANRNAESTIEEVIDKGETWIFRFSYAAEDLGQAEISRSDLVKSKWRYQIPTRIGEVLKEKGYPPSIG